MPTSPLRGLTIAFLLLAESFATLKHLEPFDEVHAAQLLLEVLALGLTGTILKEREKRDSSDNLSGVETNKEVQRAVAEVVEHIPKLGPWAEKVRLLPTPNRQQCFTEPFNELLLSCGRAHAVKLSFRVLEWMEALTIPKNSFTYEAIGVNVVKRITRLKKVWDLPQAPEDNACPEVVFAGRSNVGKSSLECRGQSTESAARVVLVDPYSTGAMLAPELDLRGYAVIALWTKECGENRGHLPQAAEGFPEKFLAEVDEQDTLEATAFALRAAGGQEPQEPLAVICGGETGVKIADALSEHMGLRGNTTTGMPNRRDKQVQQDAVQAFGLRSVRSVCGRQWSEVQDFAETEVLPMIVKPVESAGSDGVKLCNSLAEVEEHFQLLMTSQRKCGAQGAAVLLQEYLKGTEYIVDHVSRDGVHKTTMVWVYDRRPANGAGFVCFGQQCVLPDSPVAQQLIAYTRGCLDALRITDGATHTEVMMTETGPCLVEVNSRCHGAAGSWMPLARAMTGYTQVDACVDAFLDAEAFHRLPEVPPPFQAAGQVSMLVSYHEGQVEATQFQKVRELQSVVFLEENLLAGHRVEKTIDLFSLVGMCVLVHSDPDVLANDLDSIRQMEHNGSLFVLAN
ncbi:unnamed protein product [Effrenium voratum]|uniref:ATP-grasp domain-containing protein n=1 Tax=Effrenium voratum TaxID=2562239 RepID=A0AA36HZZ7_9DINO|nr:unnamed protein product [Effrenium voratum]